MKEKALKELKGILDTYQSLKAENVGGLMYETYLAKVEALEWVIEYLETESNTSVK